MPLTPSERPWLPVQLCLVYPTCVVDVWRRLVVVLVTGTSVTVTAEVAVTTHVAASAARIIWTAALVERRAALPIVASHRELHIDQDHDSHCRQGSIPEAIHRPSLSSVVVWRWWVQLKSNTVYCTKRSSTQSVCYNEKYRTTYWSRMKTAIAQVSTRQGHYFREAETHLSNWTKHERHVRCENDRRSFACIRYCHYNEHF